MIDLDRTLTRRDTYLPFLIGFLKRHPWRALRALVLPGAVLVYKTGLRDNSWLKQQFLNAVLAGLRRDRIEPWVEEFCHIVIENGLRAGALARLQLHRKEGARLVLATASLDLYVERLGAKLGFQDIICTQAAWHTDRRLSGTLASKNCHGQEKLDRVKSWLWDHGERHVDMAYSDHHSDIPLLSFARAGIAVNPTPALIADAPHYGLSIEDWDRAP